LPQSHAGSEKTARSKAIRSGGAQIEAGGGMLAQELGFSAGEA